MTRRDPETPPLKTRRRGGDKAGGIPILLRRFGRAGKPAACGRYATLQPMQAGSIPEEVPHAECGWDVFDITSLAYGQGIENSDIVAFDTKLEHLSPGL